MSAEYGDVEMVLRGLGRSEGSDVQHHGIRYEPTTWRLGNTLQDPITSLEMEDGVVVDGVQMIQDDMLVAHAEGLIMAEARRLE
jgi:hypothetical protein